jgi:hypothetical protein
MLTCEPCSIFNWDFDVLGADAGQASMTLDFWFEQGTITLGGDQFTIRKHGMMSGHWSLEKGDEPIADAVKPSALFRSFDVLTEGLTLTVAAQSPFTRRFNIFAGNEVIGVVRPTAWFFRRTVIECPASVPETIQLFCFWLAVLTWRRTARSNNNQG